MRERVSKEKITWACMYTMGFPGGSSGKEFICQCRRHKRSGIDPWVRKIPWKRAWQPTPEFLPGESHGQSSLVGYGPKSHKESDVAEATQHARMHARTSDSNLDHLFLILKIAGVFRQVSTFLIRSQEFSSLKKEKKH